MKTRKKKQASPLFISHQLSQWVAAADWLGCHQICLSRMALCVATTPHLIIPLVGHAPYVRRCSACSSPGVRASGPGGRRVGSWEKPPHGDHPRGSTLDTSGDGATRARRTVRTRFNNNRAAAAPMSRAQAHRFKGHRVLLDAARAHVMSPRGRHDSPIVFITVCHSQTARAPPPLPSTATSTTGRRGGNHQPSAAPRGWG